MLPLLRCKTIDPIGILNILPYKTNVTLQTLELFSAYARFYNAAASLPSRIPLTASLAIKIKHAYSKPKLKESNVAKQKSKLLSEQNSLISFFFSSFLFLLSFLFLSFLLFSFLYIFMSIFLSMFFSFPLLSLSFSKYLLFSISFLLSKTKKKIPNKFYAIYLPL